MCGIAGIVGPRANPGVVEQMLALMKHRGPDDLGVYTSETAVLGNRRLSVIDLSPAGHQPMSNEDGTIWMTYNGEVYNYLELREKLSNHRFRSRTDTEAIIHAYEERGECCIQDLIGMFAFAIWDSSARRLFLARDRLGIKPLYYHTDKENFLFASEIKPLLVAGAPRKPNDSAIRDYLKFGYYDHGDDTFFEGIKQVPPGHYLTLKDGRVDIMCYWDLASRVSSLESLSDEEYCSRFMDLLKDSVRLRLRSDVPIGVQLSSGLDSTCLVYLVNQLMGGAGELETFTKRHDEEKYDEGLEVQKHVEALNCFFHFTWLAPEEVWPLARKVLWLQEQPYGGLPTLEDWKLMESALQKRVTVLLQGQGADELFAGYTYFYGAYYLDLLSELRLGEFFAEVRAIKKLRALSLIETLKFLRTSFDACLRPSSQDATKNVNPGFLSHGLRTRHNNPEFTKPFRSRLSNMLYRDLRYTKLPRVLRFMDRLSMDCSRELRVPYLDHRLVEFAFSIPGNQKIRRGINKFILRNSFTGLIPEELRMREKLAVSSPQTDWLRTYLKDKVREIIYSDSFAKRGYFDAKNVRQEFEKFVRYGHCENSFPFWQCVNLELWFRMFIDPPSIPELSAV
jgi:asparagine synthase (glutamine-hydrolysing)